MIELVFIWIVVFIAGMLFGSFANVLIYRIPRQEEWVRTPSHCTECGSELRWYDLIPVVSWLALAGRCRVCKNGISLRYPLVELINGLLWLACLAALGLTPMLPVALAVSTALLVMTVIDWQTQEIPDGLNLFLLIVGVLWNGYGLYAGYGIWLANLIGFFSVSVLLLLIAILTRGGVGGGDIKLMAVCGLIIGWQNALLSLALGCIIGTIVMLPGHIRNRRGRRHTIPFGPFLAAGVWIAMLFGADLIQLYLRLFWVQ